MNDITDVTIECYYIDVRFIIRKFEKVEYIYTDYRSAIAHIYTLFPFLILTSLEIYIVFN